MKEISKKIMLFFILFLFIASNLTVENKKRILDDRLLIPKVAYAESIGYSGIGNISEDVKQANEAISNSETQTTNKNEVTVNEYVEAIENIDGGSFLERALAEVLANIIGSIMVVLCSISDFKTLDAIVFNAGSTADRFLPLSSTDWSRICSWYGIISAIGGSILFVSIMTVFFKFIKASTNPHYRKDAISALKRLLLSAIIIGVAPIIIQLFLYINNCMVEAFYSALSNGKSLQDTFKGTTIISTLNLSSPLVGVLILALFSYLTIKVNIIFIIRNFNLIVYMLFTPFAVNLWVIDENMNGAKVWLGEILSNIFMQTAYAFMFSVYISFMEGKSWITQLIWGNLIIALADVLRNAVQGKLTEMSGLNESAMANSFILKQTGVMAGLAGMTGLKLSKAKGQEGGQILSNIMKTFDGAKEGNANIDVNRNNKISIPKVNNNAVNNGNNLSDIISGGNKVARFAGSLAKGAVMAGFATAGIATGNESLINTGNKIGNFIGGATEKVSAPIARVANYTLEETGVNEKIRNIYSGAKTFYNNRIDKIPNKVKEVAKVALGKNTDDILKLK